MQRDLNGSTTIHLWTADAVVLFDWIMSIDFNQLAVNHKAEKQALVDLLTRLEIPLHGVSQDEIDRARDLVAEGTDWG